MENEIRKKSPNCSMTKEDELASEDPEIFTLMQEEYHRQRNSLQLIASENMASRAVMCAQGSVMTNKYAEGYANKRYYQGCSVHDKVESLAVERLCKLFNCNYANVQPHSGSQANQAVFLALLKPGDNVLGFSLNSGGHLTHGAAPNISGKWFNAIQYEVDPSSYLIDMNQVEDLAKKYKPKLIIAGASAYPRHIDFPGMKQIASSVGALLLADIAHYSGLIAGGQYPSPFPYSDIVTSTTHKTLRGPRGGIIMCNDQDIMKKINSAVFPGLQGGPFMHSIMAKAVAFLEASSPRFKLYCKEVVNNARILAATLMDQSIDVLTGGTDSHIVLCSLAKQKLTGKKVANDLEQGGIVCNKNAIPFDPMGPFITSGIRLGTAFETTRGLKNNSFVEIGNMISYMINKSDESSGMIYETRSKVEHLLKQFT